MRKAYLDNIRWSTVLLVVIYHVFYLFNAAGVLGSVGCFAKTQYQDILLYAVYPWFMVLLFVVAGISARYSLEKRSNKDFIKSRTIKLLLPSTLGLFVFQWLVGYLNIYIGGGLEYMTEVPKPILYLIFAISGIGPLWFAQMLWLFSLALVLIRRIDRDDRLYALCGKTHPLLLILFCFALWGGAQIGNVPVLTFYRFGIYGVAFLIGYFVLSHEKIQKQLTGFCLPLLAVSLVMMVIYVIYYFGQDYTSNSCLRSFFTNLYAWSMTLTVLASFQKWFDRETVFTQYMSHASWGIYVLHYLFVLAACQALKTYTRFPVAVIYILASVITLACTVICWEILQRIPLIRFAVLGTVKKK